MATLADAAAFARDDEVHDPLTAAVVAAAIAIMYEDGATPHHGERTALATQVLRNPSSITDAFAWALSTNTTVVDKWNNGDHAGAISDFPYVISTVWDAIAGAPAE